MHIAMMLSFVISVKGKEEENLYYLYYSRTLIKVIYFCLWTWVNMLLKWKTRAKPKFFISLSFIFCKMEKEIFCYNPLEIYHSIQSRAFVCHFFSWGNRPAAFTTIWQLVVCYHFQFLIDDLLLGIWQRPRKQEEKVVSGKERRMEKKEHETSIAKQHREVTQAH